MSESNQYVDVLFELGCEELPPLNLYQLGQSLYQSVCQQLTDRAINFDVNNSCFYASPRRLAFILKQTLTNQPDTTVEKRGPAVQAAYNQQGEPTPAALGFAKSVGAEISQLSTLKTDKGEWLAFTVTEKGESIEQLMPAVLDKAIKQLPIAKAMRWGDNDFSFIRPVHWLILMQDKQLIPYQLFGVNSDHYSVGHRFYSQGAVEINGANDYVKALTAAHVMVDHRQREAMIKQQVNQAVAAVKGQAVIRDNLLREVASITEWPHAILGTFDKAFLGVPKQALISSMEKHQKYFPVVDKEGELMPYFVAIANIQSKQPEKMTEGFEKVIKPRLADAQFFWQKDLKRPLEQNIPLLEKMVFEEQLGSIKDKTDRVAQLMAWLSKDLGFDQQNGIRAAELMKTDLISDMVGEFADLQGLMGSYYAEAQGESAAVATAIREQYLPAFSGDDIPSSDVGQALAMSDKMDTLCGIFAVGKKPSGSKDPFALRRAALGIIQILSKASLPINYTAYIQKSVSILPLKNIDKEAVVEEVLSFFKQRLRQQLIDNGINYDVVDAALAKRPHTLSDLSTRIDALIKFKQADQASALVESNKRITNILKKSDSVKHSVNPDIFELSAESDLWQDFMSLQDKLETVLKQGDYPEVLKHLIKLNEPVSRFFEEVMVNAEDEKIRRNRIAVLQALSEAFNSFAFLHLLSIDS